MTYNVNLQTFSLPHNLSEAVEATLDDWHAHEKVKSLWGRDASLWTGGDESKWLGWLNIVGEQKRSIRRFTNFAEEVKDARFSHVLLLGMGGSSLCPEVMRKSFGKRQGFPELHVLDSTDPAQIKSFENRIDLANTLFFVSSKSGTTLEPDIFKQYFFERARLVVGNDEAGNRFIAITDPGSKLRQEAERDRFRKIFLGVPSIGGRYSALSDFGLAPAAAMGVDIEKFLNRTDEMVAACGPDTPPHDNPGVILGAVLGAAHNHGRDKITMVASAGISDLGAWLEQLLAESTGKNGKGLIPVDRESIGPPENYGDDRLFVYLKLNSDSLSASINPFDQPDVEASKIATRKLTEEYERTGALPDETPMFEAEGVKLFADARNALELNRAVSDRSLMGYLKAHLARLQANDYFATLAYVEMNDAHEQLLQSMRHDVRDAKRSATCLGFGPRFLHSTGQAYKGGPNTGVFLQVTCDDANDLPVPGQEYTFGIVKAAQARGDFAVLAERGRRALRIHIGPDAKAG